MHQSVEVSGQSLELLPERAVFWVEQQMLLVADAHFGKAASFRARGVPVPEATTAENLLRLTHLVTLWKPRRIVFLGDFVHAREAGTDPTRGELAAWRGRHMSLGLTLVRGNHDDPGGDLPAALGIDVEEEPWPVGRFALCHHPQVHEQLYVLAGHLHPAYRLAGRANETARLPCFWFRNRSGVLPAFGAFTGAVTIRACRGERIFLAGPERVHALPLEGSRR
jgi:DNA ligase-associated metallophosphoesterase